MHALPGLDEDLERYKIVVSTQSIYQGVLFSLYCNCERVSYNSVLLEVEELVKEWGRLSLVIGLSVSHRRSVKL